MNSNDLHCGLLEQRPPLWKTVVVASLPAGVMFGAAILSLVVPYVQHLGVPHAWASFVWLCGPVSGILIQPIVGYISDRSTSRFGRRKPFIIAGVGLACVSVLTIGYALESGVALGDSMGKSLKPRGVALFVIGFWFLDVANNVIQGPTRALLADLSRENHRHIRIVNALCSFFMAIGSILGYLASSYSNIYKLIPFTHNEICDVFCANLKTCFLLHIIFLLTISTFALTIISEPKFKNALNKNQEPFFKQLKSAITNLKKPIWLLYLVTALNWIAWFPFLLYNTDWVGREVYGGDVAGNPQAKALYDAGVREGTWGLMLTAVATTVMSLFIDPLSKVLGGSRKLWGWMNFVLAAVLAATVLVTEQAKLARRSMAAGDLPSSSVRTTTLYLFAIMGTPQAVTLGLPYALASIFSSDSGAGQGLSLGILNLSISIPQMMVSVISGFWDSLFGGGNLPAFVLGAVAAVLSGILALTVLPSPSSNT